LLKHLCTLLMYIDPTDTMWSLVPLVRLTTSISRNTVLLYHPDYLDVLWTSAELHWIGSWPGYFITLLPLQMLFGISWHGEIVMNIVCFKFGTSMIMHSLPSFIWVSKNILRIVFILNRQFCTDVTFIQFKRIFVIFRMMM